MNELMESQSMKINDKDVSSGKRRVWRAPRVVPFGSLRSQTLSGTMGNKEGGISPNCGRMTNMRPC